MLDFNTLIAMGAGRQGGARGHLKKLVNFLEESAFCASMNLPLP